MKDRHDCGLYPIEGRGTPEGVNVAIRAPQVKLNGCFHLNATNAKALNMMGILEDSRNVPECDKIINETYIGLVNSFIPAHGPPPELSEPTVGKTRSTGFKETVISGSSS
jgi:hypothetical protein